MTSNYDAMTRKADIKTPHQDRQALIESWLLRETLNRLAGVGSRFGPRVAAIHFI
jgi:hypothetical protein